ncbi:hypothetical protein ACMXYQ_08395 [Neptuniibacter sp. PT34_22]|uniref:hypothetical protein n=1 Tax=Neptuniibacter sp. PT34_22 TaxID=3398205 RepID=UPI0039F4B035
MSPETEIVHYFKRQWNESRGDKYDSWGASDWWFETDHEGYITRCVQVYNNGNVLFYSESHREDKYGILPEGNLDLSEFREFATSKDEFESTLNEAVPINAANI